MSFLSLFALGVALLVAAPYVAHRLRRQHAETRAFAPVRLVSKTPPNARRRGRIEDRALFSLRALAIVALALLGASPLLTCSRLALSRTGASVAIAIVLDDSMSMRALDTTGRSRFERARAGAREILNALKEGDAVALVLAGGAARVELSVTLDLSAARTALDGIAESDRGTDLDGALTMARTLLARVPQADRRVVVLSDRADGKSESAPLGEGGDIPIWVAMPELNSPLADCGVLAADRSSNRVRVRFACSSIEATARRQIEVKDGETVMATQAIPQALTGEVTLLVPGDDAGATNDARFLVAGLTGSDALPSDDSAPVVTEAGQTFVAVVSDRTEEALATGGAPVVEQALTALQIEMAVRAVPQVPDRGEDVASFAALVIDDPPGFTPEQRRTLRGFVDAGGLLLVALGRRAASAPLGASFEPLLAQSVSWKEAPVPAVDVASGAAFFGEAAPSLGDLAPKGRATIADSDADVYEPLAKWNGGAVLVGRHAIGRGEVWLTTLPFSVESSELTLRPAFLVLLDAFASEAKARASKRRGNVGTPWTFLGAHAVEARRESGVSRERGTLKSMRQDGTLRLVPELLGSYALTIDDRKERRVAAPVPSELDFRPHAFASQAASPALGGGVASVDISWIVALALLGFVAAELILRAVIGYRVAASG